MRRCLEDMAVAHTFKATIGRLPAGIKSHALLQPAIMTEDLVTLFPKEATYKHLALDVKYCGYSIVPC